MLEKILTKKPFWWFLTGKEWGDVALTWGNRIYCREDRLRDDILVHERVHIRQNKGKWYLSLWFLIRSTFDNKFYRKLEKEAYEEQYKYLCESSESWYSVQVKNILRNL